ncbi:hypothetical protein JZ751_017300 [Albula glossodonta]|uniref:Uncharacterized protein n=1 Tax=Albula glossodonta TaxID=121402 RepID=A0A8T2MUE8_9TELE|nr:hypothetical protein JZ751_017300 [Albula glossodonta]
MAEQRFWNMPRHNGTEDGGALWVMLKLHDLALYLAARTLRLEQSLTHPVELCLLRDPKMAPKSPTDAGWKLSTTTEEDILARITLSAFLKRQRNSTLK